MDFTRKLRFAIFALAASTLPSAIGETIINQTYTGTFPATISGSLTNQATALEEAITLPMSGSLTVFTTSYASGGFEPNLTLFNSAGDFVTGSGTPGTSPNATTDPSTGLGLDAYLTANFLNSGQYTIALTDWQLNQSITATNLSDGFTSNYGNGMSFIDQAQNTRTGNYTLVAQLTQTPEPATVWLIIPSLAMVGLVARKRVLAFGINK